MSPSKPQLDEASRGTLASAISNLLVRLLTEYTGRGPTKARTYIHDDVITVVMGDTLTKGERRLVQAERSDHVRMTRRMFQDIMRDDIVSGVEELTGRKVIAFMSDNHIDPDLAVETVILAPREDGRG